MRSFAAISSPYRCARFIAALFLSTCLFASAAFAGTPANDAFANATDLGTVTQFSAVSTTVGATIDRFGSRSIFIAGALAQIRGWSTARFRFDFVPPRRGFYPEMAPRLSTAFPFGVWKCSRTIDVAKPLRVWPVVPLLLGMVVARYVPTLLEDGPSMLWAVGAFGPLLMLSLIHI